jgi:hypothetical protein
MKIKTSLKIVRNTDGSCNVNVSFSDEDKLRHDDSAVLFERLKDASSPEFYNFVFKKGR